MEISKENLLQLKLRHFQFFDNKAVYSEGSVSNYRKIEIFSKRKMFSLVDDKLIDAHYVIITTFQEPGYLEVDSYIEKRIYIREDKLVDFLISNNVLTDEEFQMKRRLVK